MSIKNELIQILGANSLETDNKDIKLLCRVINYMNIQMNAIQLDCEEGIITKKDIADNIIGIKEQVYNMLQRRKIDT